MQREKLKPSEKAFAYRMKLEALKQQGKRSELTSTQVVTKLEENPTLNLHRIIDGFNNDGLWGIRE